MQELKLADDLFINLFDGSKTSTVRLGKREITLGALALESVSGGWGVIVNVTEVKHKKLSELSDDEAATDGGATAEQLKEALKRFYPESHGNSDITIITFTFKDPLDIPEEAFYE